MKFRDRVFVSFPEGKVEGYIYAILPGEKELYVILTGQNTKPVLVQLKNVELISDNPPKRKRGRPRKDEK